MFRRIIEGINADKEEPIRLGQTPHSIIWEEKGLQLRYFPPKSKENKRPLFVCTSLLNHWALFDLLPGMSVIEEIINTGYPVYLLGADPSSFKEHSPSLGVVVDQLIPQAVSFAEKHGRSRHSLAMLGYGTGGTFAAICLSRHPKLSSALAMVCAPIDFQAAGRSAYSSSSASLEDILTRLEELPTAQATNPQNRMLWEQWDQPGFKELWQTLEQWNNQDIGSELYREFVQSCYFDNALMTGSWLLDGKRVDLTRARLPALVIAGQDDHICPPEAAYGLRRVWGGRVTLKTLTGGHISICLSPELPMEIIQWLQY